MGNPEKILTKFAFSSAVLNLEKYTIWGKYRFPRAVVVKIFSRWEVNNEWSISNVRRINQTTLDHFGLILCLKISKSLQKMAKEWWKIDKKLEIFQKYSKLPKNAFGAS